MAKRVATLLLCIITILVSTNCVLAFNSDEHDDYLEKVLFGKTVDYGEDTKQGQALKALESASYICVDQYNGGGTEELEYLKSRHILGIPSNIAEINFTSNAYHRKYTHRGWDHNYGKKADNAKWPVRKNVLLATVDKEFNFGIFSNKLTGYNKKCESFAALVYYVHLLGDRIADNKYYNASVIMDVGGRTLDKEDIISELKKHLDRLFDTKTKNGRVYKSMMLKIDSINRRLSKLDVSGKGLQTEEDYYEYHKCAVELMDVLIKNIPSLLKEEKFFKSVFY